MLDRNVQLRRQFDFIYITKIILEGANAIQYGDSGHNNSGWLLNYYPVKLIYLNFHPLELCLANATHNFEWLKITHIYLVWAQKHLQILTLTF